MFDRFRTVSYELQERKPGGTWETKNTMKDFLPETNVDGMYPGASYRLVEMKGDGGMKIRWHHQEPLSMDMIMDGIQGASGGIAPVKPESSGASGLFSINKERIESFKEDLDSLKTIKEMLDSVMGVTESHDVAGMLVRGEVPSINFSGQLPALMHPYAMESMKYMINELGGVASKAIREGMHPELSKKDDTTKETDSFAEAKKLLEEE